MKMLKMKNRNNKGGIKKNVPWIKYIAIVLVAFLLVSCSEEEKVTIRGLYPDGSGEMLTIEMLNINQLILIDSIKVKNNGSFKTKIDLDNPELVLVKNKQGKIINLLTFPGDIISLDIPCLEFSTCYTVQGSPESEHIKSLVLKVEETKVKLDSISDLLNLKGDFDDSDPLILEFTEIFKKQRMHNIKFVIENISSLSSVYALYQRLGPEEYILSGTRDLQYLIIVADSVKNKYPNSTLVTSLVQDVTRKKLEYENMLFLSKVKDKEVNETGSIDLNIPDEEGIEVSLNSLRGKVVMLNFWASYDENSLGSNKLLKSIYEQYHVKGFEVYSVSMDNNKTAWRDAIRFEEYNWIDVCELTYPNSYAASIYNISAIPTSFLIDKEGNIVAKNLNGKVLSTWLDNLL